MHASERGHEAIVHVEGTRMTVKMTRIADQSMLACREKKKTGVSGWNTVAVNVDIECMADVTQSHQAARRVVHLLVVYLI